MSGGRLRIVAPHATRTGSTQVLLQLLDALDPVRREHLAVEVRADGARRGELEAFGRPLLVGEVPIGVIANSCLAADAVLDHPGVPSLVYVHEPADVLVGLDGRVLAGLLRADRVLGVSDAIVDAVVALGVDRDRTSVLPPVVVARKAVADAVAAAARDAGGSAGARLVVGCGEASWRKGTDLFIEAAARLAEDPDLHFAWVGRRHLPFSRQLDLDVCRSGLAGRMSWIGDVADAGPYLAAASVLVMPSRQDPLPLAPLEAAIAGTPTAAFAVGGLNEYAEAGIVRAVPYPDVAILARAARCLLDDGPMPVEVVTRARRWVANRQAGDVVLPRFRYEVEQLLARGRR